jgi:hypothetical protein
VSGLCSSLTCVLFGVTGVLGVVAGIAAVSTPAVMLRRTA